MERFVWRDRAGRRRVMTINQQKVLFYHRENPQASQTEIARVLKLSQACVRKAFHNPAFRLSDAHIAKMQDDCSMLALEEKRRILATIVRSTISDFVSGEGVITVEPANPARAAVAEYEVITNPTTGAVERRKIKLISRLEAIDLDNKMVGAYPRETPGQTNNNLQINILVSSEREKGLVEKLGEKLQRVINVVPSGDKTIP